MLYLNGEYIAPQDAKISVFDRGFLFADSLYEVIPVYAGKAFFLDKHLLRLQQGLAAIELSKATATIDWQGIIETVIEKNGGGDQALYLQISRGVSFPRDHDMPKGLSPTVLVSSSPLSRSLTTVSDLVAIAAISREDTRWKRCDLKTTALIANVMLRQEAVNQGCQETILINDGEAIEGAASNLFVVVDGVVHTAAKGPKILAGVTRDLLVELLQSDTIDIPFEESAVTQQQLCHATEIWTSSSTKEIRPVTELDGQQVGDGGIGPLCRQLTQHYLARKQQWIAARLDS